MTSITALFLPVALFAILCAVAPAEEETPLLGLLAPHSAIGSLLRKRSLEAAAMRPPVIYDEPSIESPSKRGDGFIWVPDRGWIALPKEVTEKPISRSGTLFRYG